jgi:hypothetical protein
MHDGISKRIRNQGDQTREDVDGEKKVCCAILTGTKQYFAIWIYRSTYDSLP